MLPSGGVCKQHQRVLRRPESRRLQEARALRDKALREANHAPSASVAARPTQTRYVVDVRPYSNAGKPQVAASSGAASRTATRTWSQTSSGTATRTWSRTASRAATRTLARTSARAGRAGDDALQTQQRAAVPTEREQHAQPCAGAERVRPTQQRATTRAQQTRAGTKRVVATGEQDASVPSTMGVQRAPQTQRRGAVPARSGAVGSGEEGADVPARGRAASKEVLQPKRSATVHARSGTVGTERVVGSEVRARHYYAPPSKGLRVPKVVFQSPARTPTEVYQDQEHVEHSALDDDCIFLVMALLSTCDLLAAMRVCRAWSRVAKDAMLWSFRMLSPHKDVSLTSVGHMCSSLGASIVRLNVAGCADVCDAAVSHIVAHCPHLAYLDASTSSVSDTGLGRLSKGCLDLQTLLVSRCFGVTDVGVVRLAHGCRYLRALSLMKCYRVGDVGVRALGASCASLSIVDLSSTNVGDEGVAALARGCPLVTLTLAGCSKVTDTGFQALGACTALRHVNVKDCFGISEPAVAAVVGATGPTVQYHWTS